MPYNQQFVEAELDNSLGRDRFKQVYVLFIDHIYKLHLAGLEVPKSHKKQFHFMMEIRSHAFDALLWSLLPHDNSVMAMLALHIPDMIFARMDHLPPENFVASLGSGSLEAWDEAMRLITHKLNWNASVTIGDALDIVQMRLSAEACQHLPMSDFFRGAAHAH